VCSTHYVSAVGLPDLAAIGVVVGFAFMLGVSDAPNASAALIAARAGGYRTVMAFSFVVHVVGGIIAGQAVAVTMTSLVHVPAHELSQVYLAGGLPSLCFTLVATRRGVPVSASIAIVGGLAGAAAVEGGLSAVGWGGLHGLHPYGVAGTLAALVVSPLLGGVASAATRGALGAALRRASRRALGPVRGSIWVTAGVVALADGSNDGQKAMGLATAVLVASGVIKNFGVPFWVKAMVAVVLATGTAAGGRRIVNTVSSKFYRGGPLDGLSAQSSAAMVIIGAALLGAPVSTSTVLDSAVIGTGAARRRRHVHWPTVATVAAAWAVTVPACAVLGALVEMAFKFAGSVA